MTAPDAGRAPALDQAPTLRITAGAADLSPTGDGFFVVGADAFVRAQLPIRFGAMQLALPVLDRSTEWWQLLVHTCVAHLLPNAPFDVVDPGARTGLDPRRADQDRLVTKLAASTGLDPVDPVAHPVTPEGAGDRRDALVERRRRTGRRTIHDLVAIARSSLERLTPAQLAQMLGDPTVVVLDTRTPTDREGDGVIAGSVHAPRTVLEWVVDPASGYADDFGPDARIVVVCNEGYSSSLAARTLQELGFEMATDLIGGMQAWRAAGLPTVAPTTHHGRCLLPEEHATRGGGVQASGGGSTTG